MWSFLCEFMREKLKWVWFSVITRVWRVFSSHLNGIFLVFIFIIYILLKKFTEAIWIKIVIILSSKLVLRFFYYLLYATRILYKTYLLYFKKTNYREKWEKLISSGIIVTNVTICPQKFEETILRKLVIKLKSYIVSLRT